MDDKNLVEELLLVIISNRRSIELDGKLKTEIVKIDTIKKWCALNDLNWPDQLPF